MLVPNNNITFSFTGKERDSETGFGYFGARYYASSLPVPHLQFPLQRFCNPLQSSIRICNPLKQ